MDPKASDDSNAQAQAQAQAGYNPQMAEPPTDLNQVWNWPKDSIGYDWKKRPEIKEEGLFPEQITNLKSDLMKNVQFLKFLGSGGWGQVFQAEADHFVASLQEWKRFRFACKVIRHEEATKSGVFSSFADIRVLRYLRHENICNMADFISIKDSETGFPFAIICLFLELCDGDLKGLHIEAESQNVGKSVTTPNAGARRILPPNLSRHWFAQIARAFDYLHSNGVAHQDMKLANILFRLGEPISDSYEDRFLSSTFKLADFGNSMIERRAMVSRGQQSRYENDINWLYLLWHQIGIPVPRETVRQATDFATQCQAGQVTATDPWITPDIIDMCARIGVMRNKWTASQILQHPWLQNNDEPRTQHFIVRPENLEGHRIWNEQSQTWTLPS